MCGPRLPILRVHVRKDSAEGDGDSFVSSATSQNAAACLR